MTYIIVITWAAFTHLEKKVDKNKKAISKLSFYIMSSLYIITMTLTYLQTYMFKEFLLKIERSNTKNLDQAVRFYPEDMENVREKERQMIKVLKWMPLGIIVF